MAAVKLLALQAAISLENTYLYGDLAEREAKIRRLVDSNVVGIVIWDLEGRVIDANDRFLDMLGYDRSDLVAGRMRWTELTPPDLRAASDRRVADLQTTGTFQPYEKAYFRKDGSRVPVLVGGAIFDDEKRQGVAFAVDLSDRKRAEEAARESERRYREIQMELAHANRVATMGQLSASIAHEVSQPVAGTITNAQAALRLLDAQPLNTDGFRRALERIVRDGNRAGEVIDRVRALVKKAPRRKDVLDVNDAILDVVRLAQGEVAKHGASVKTQLASDLPHIEGDRVQLQQVTLNLIINAAEAMSAAPEGSRHLLISTARTDLDDVLVAVQDSGPGIDPANLDRIFSAFYTTKPDGLGMGLSICRAIVEADGGRLWATSGPEGARFQFTLPSRTGA
jgi:PAS domain S-box-containing protein